MSDSLEKRDSMSEKRGETWDGDLGLSPAQRGLARRRRVIRAAFTRMMAAGLADRQRRKELYEEVRVILYREHKRDWEEMQECRKEQRRWGKRQLSEKARRPR